MICRRFSSCTSPSSACASATTRRHDLVAVEPLAGGGVEGDHLPRLELAAGDDGGVVQPEHAGLAADVQPAALVRAPPHRAQAHAVHEADEHAAVGADDAGRAVPGGQAAERPPVVGEQVERFLAPDVGLACPTPAGWTAAAPAAGSSSASSIRYSTHSSRLAESLIFGVSRSPPGSGGVQAAGEGRHRVPVGADGVDLAVVAGEPERLRRASSSGTCWCCSGGGRWRCRSRTPGRAGPA